MKNSIETLAGQYFDQETGVHYNWHRSYSPGGGRYVTADPLCLAQTQTSKQSSSGSVGALFRNLLYQYTLSNPQALQLYPYVKNNPENFVDPFGLWAFLGGFGYRGTLPGIGGEIGVVGVVGTEKGEVTSQSSAYAEAFLAGGLSFGRGPFGGAWSGDISEISQATEIGIDTPLGSVSILFDFNNMHFGFTIGGGSIGAGAFAKQEPLHIKIEGAIDNLGTQERCK